MKQKIASATSSATRSKTNSIVGRRSSKKTNKRTNVTSPQRQPLVSVILPVFNSAKFLAEAIESILAQTYRRFELVIVDDASTDGSWKIISQYRRNYPSIIKAIRLKKNLNQGGDRAGSLAFQRTNPRSQFIARMDADDRSMPHRLETQVNYLLAHPRISILGGSAEVISDQGEIVGEKLVGGTSKRLYEQFFMVNPMIHPSVMLRRSDLLHPEKLYRLELNANNDYLTFAEAAARGKKIVNLSNKLIEYRVHDANDSLKNIKRTLFNTVTVRWRLVREFGYKPTFKAWICFGLQMMALSWLPESLVRVGYLVVRGMFKPEKLWADFVQKTTVKLAAA